MPEYAVRELIEYEDREYIEDEDPGFVEGEERTPIEYENQETVEDKDQASIKDKDREPIEDEERKPIEDENREAIESIHINQAPIEEYANFTFNELDMQIEEDMIIVDKIDITNLLDNRNLQLTLDINVPEENDNNFQVTKELKSDNNADIISNSKEIYVNENEDPACDRQKKTELSLTDNDSSNQNQNDSLTKNREEILHGFADQKWDANKCVSLNEEENVPSPFKKSFFWPTPPINTTKRRIMGEKIPAVASSKEWQEYFKRKEVKKNKELEKKEQNKQKRKERQEDKKNELQKKKLKTPLTEKNDDGNILKAKEPTKSDNMFSMGSFVIVRYENAFYPAKILNTDQEQYYCCAMRKSGKNWKWPQPPDLLWYSRDDVMKQIDEPKAANARGACTVPDMDQFETP